MTPYTLQGAWRFLSTPSARRATSSRKKWMSRRLYFYPRPPRGGRLCSLGYDQLAQIFLSTPSARRATPTRPVTPPPLESFLSTPSARRATGRWWTAKPCCSISIHALREEGDAGCHLHFCRCRNFYPRPPRGGRRQSLERNTTVNQFLSTPSARRATWSSDISLPSGIAYFYPRPPRGGRPPCLRAASYRLPISIHALREEGDGLRWRKLTSTLRFLSTPSARRATKFFGYPYTHDKIFLSTPSARRATYLPTAKCDKITISIHALREEGDLRLNEQGLSVADFYPRPPRGGRRPCAQRTAGRFQFLSTPSARRATHGGNPGLLFGTISIHALREEGDAAGAAKCKNQE